MNNRMARVFVGLMLAVGAVILLLTWWQVLDAGSLRDRSDNRQSAYYEQRAKRGAITLANGAPLALSKKTKTKQGDTIYERRYPQGRLAAHVVGYDTISHSRAGVEAAMDDFLSGSASSLASVVGRLRGSETVIGDKVQLTIEPQAQRIAQRELAGRDGAVAAMDPRTGRVLTLASSPSYSPNDIADNYNKIASRAGAPLLDRATQGHYVPGSTFKLVTAAAALQNGITTPQTMYPGGCRITFPHSPPLANYDNECVGRNSLTDALTHSINITFARIGEALGATRLRKQMRAFGFGSTLQINGLPSNEMSASGLLGPKGSLLPRHTPIDVARVAIGQERLGVTPLQMLLVTSSIANGGVEMAPYIVGKVTDPDGHVVQRATPKRLGTPISPQTADELTAMMKDVVQEGTGTAAALSGVNVAGKTGTADTSHGLQTWFVAFAPADAPRVAIAVTVGNQPSGAQGGTVAAPIARDVIESLLK